MKESTRVLLALVAAILLGVLIAASHNASLIRAADAIAPIGTLWVNGIRMTVIPLVVSLLITAPPDMLTWLTIATDTPHQVREALNAAARNQAPKR